MSFMSIPTILQEYNDGLLAQKDDGLEQNICIIDSLQRNWTTQIILMHLIELRKKVM